jgi:hypothetical protein
MAHFAKLNENNVVVDVLVVSNEDVQNLQYPESEPLGVAFLTSLTEYSKWKQTSYNSNFRKNYAVINGSYDAARDAFIPVKNFPSWVLNEKTCRWDAPVRYPTDGNDYYWDESAKQWVLES